MRSERLLVEQIDDDLLFRWFVGLSMDDAVWNHAVFSKNRVRLLASDVAPRFFAEVNKQAKRFMRLCLYFSESRGHSLHRTRGPRRAFFSKSRAMCRTSRRLSFQRIASLICSSGPNFTPR